MLKTQNHPFKIGSFDKFYTSMKEKNTFVCFMLHELQNS